MYSPSYSGSQWGEQDQHDAPSHLPQPFTPNDLHLVNQRLADLGLRAGPPESLAMSHAPPSGQYQPRRTGGTNVDPESVRSDLSGDDADYVDDWRETVPRRAQSVRSHDRRTAVSNWDVSRGSVASDQDSVERMTMGGTSIWTSRGVEGDMLAMRDRLQAEADAAAERHDRELHSQLINTSKLSSTVTRLQDAEEQLRTLQATLIAEKVGRTEAERRSQIQNDEVKKFKTELAGAVRALRRAREEAKRGEEERRRVLRGWEEAKERLHRYHEELKVRDARAKGKEEGRQEAFIEIERWMTAPPIPVEPITDIPNVIGASPHNRLNQLSPGPNHMPVPQTTQRTPGQQHMQMPVPQQGQYPQQMPSSFSSPGYQALQHAPSAGGFNAPPPGQFGASQGDQGRTTPGFRPMSRQDQGRQGLEHGTPRGTPHRQPSVPPPQHGTPGREPSLPPPGPFPSSDRHFYNPADSYLDHVEHDPKLQEMLHGAPTRTFHTSFGQTDPSRQMTSGPHSHAPQEHRPPSRQMDPRGTMHDKPLPEPRDVPMPMPMPMPDSGSDFHRAQSTAHRSRHRPSTQGDLKHSRSMSQIPDGDRYPVFPRPQGAGHSRQSSRDQGFPHQPPPQSLAQSRSRLAGGLRSDLDLGEPELDRIEEEAQSQRPRRADTMFDNGGSQHHHRTRSHPSMPSLKQRPIPKMPAPLSQGPRESDERENRRSFLGLSGLGSRQAPSAPTITVQPPSRSPHRGPSVPPPASHHPDRQTITVTEPFDQPRMPHDIPLPQSRTTTMYSAAPQPRDISIIDYAMQRPLPESRPQTTYSAPGKAATVETETDAEAPRSSRPQTRQSKRSAPRNLSKPASRRPKASTYAGTVATIEEITEEESGRETRR